MGDLVQALQLIDRADKYRDSQDIADYKRHYFVHAYILYQLHDYEKYEEALTLLKKAIALDSKYHAAVFLKYNVEAILFTASFDEQFSNLETYYIQHIKPTGDNALIGDYFQSLGLLYSRYEKYDKAIKALEKAEKHQHCEANIANIAIAYYFWAVEKNQKGDILHRANIDYTKMLKMYGNVDRAPV